MLVVMAFGGDTRLRSGDSIYAAHAIASVARDHTVVVTYGNGHASSPAEGPEVYQALLPHILGAESDRTNPNLLEEALGNEMPGTRIASLGTGVAVRLLPVGPHYVDTPDGRRWVAALGWMVTQDGNGFRRCQPSPEPQTIVELNTIKALIDAGALVICALEEGIAPNRAVFELRQGPDEITADMGAALLAEQVGADLLMLLASVDVASVEVDWRRGLAPNVDENTIEALRRITFATGSVGPKVEAAYRFVESTGKRAAIGALANAPDILRGDSGIQVKAYRS